MRHEVQRQDGTDVDNLMTEHNESQVETENNRGKYITIHVSKCKAKLDTQKESPST